MAGRAVTRGGRITSRAIVPATSITPPENIPPSDVTNLRVTGATETVVSLAWDVATDAGGSGLAGYDLYRVVGGVNTLIASPTVTSYDDTGRTAATSYTYRVKARDNNGNVSANFASVTATTDDAVTPVGSWPIQSISAGWGITLNATTDAGDWEANANTLWNALDTAGRDDWTWSRIQLTWDVLEPAPPVSGVHTYNFNASQAKEKIGWCVSKGIRPVILFTFAPYWATVQGQYANCTITNTGLNGRARIYATNITTRNRWIGLHARSTALPTNTRVLLEGSDGNGTYVECDVAATAPGTGKTVTFGGHRTGGVTYHSGEDNHMGCADGNGATSTRGTAAMLEGSVNGHLAAAQALVAFIYNVRLSYPGVDPIVEYWNEANGDHGYRPGYDVARYNTTLRYLYRALKEYDPTIPLAQTGANNNTGETPGQGRSLNGYLFLRESWRHMKADPAGPDGATDTWATWQTTTTPLVNTVNIGGGTIYDVSTTTLNSLRTAGSISTKFWLDLGGLHTYGFGRPQGGGAYFSWLRTGLDSDPAARIVTVLNDMYTEDPTSGKTGLNKMKIIQTEAGPPFHPGAVTGQGATAAVFGVNIPQTASEEEAYFFTTILKQLMKPSVRAWPTGGAVPTKLFTGNVGARIALINIQRLNEVANETYAGADVFTHQGAFAAIAAGGVAKGALKRKTGTTRPTLTTGIYTTALIGVGNDFVEAFNNTWS